MQKVLIANRGEIAVRVIRACRDYGIGSVAIYAEGDRESLHVKLADEAYSLEGESAADTYLRTDKILGIARRAGADAIHPGYGFLSENADFAESVVSACLIWIGPPPSAIRQLGDKVSARHVARDVGAPLTPGTSDPVSGPDDVTAFAREFGVPVAIKAAHGGGGRGLKVAYSLEEIPELYASAVREAEVAFGRGECFVERYLERPRHVEAQIMADAHGNVVVVGTRDCTLQRRHQKLVEEAPAPFLSQSQRDQIYRAAEGLALRTGYIGAGTVEFLVAASGEVSFLEVNTRLQVEHPVTEETSGLDLVCEQFRVADGQMLGYSEVSTRGHSIEFRVNGEDPGRNFMPVPGTVTALRWPAGPGIRVDAGIEAGWEISRYFDSLMAKIVVTGDDRAQALSRARRALKETNVEGAATVLDFHRAVLNDPAFAPADPDSPFTVHTKWIETEFSTKIPPFETSDETDVKSAPRETIVVEVNGKRYSVNLPKLSATAAPTQEISGTHQRGSATPRSTARPSRTSPSRSAEPPKKSSPAVGQGTVLCPMQGTIVRVAVAEGETVEQGDVLMVLEAMKMEQPITAPFAGTVAGLSVGVGASVAANQVLCTVQGAAQ